MKVFIAMKAPHRDPDLVELGQVVARAVRESGHDPFLAWQAIERGGLDDPRDFMPYVRGELREAGLLVLLYQADLRGGLLEAGMAYAWGIPIWLVHRAGERVSSSARGCAARILAYENPAGCAAQIAAALGERGSSA